MNYKREKEKEIFLNNLKYTKAKRTLIAGDASYRKYERLLLDNKKTLILMDAPPEYEDIKPFISIAKYLKKLGLSAPKIFHSDVVNGFILLEDFGDATYTRILNNNYNEEALYQLATDVLIKLHSSVDKKTIPDCIKIFSRERIINEISLINDWYIPLKGKNHLNRSAKDEYIEIWNNLIPHSQSVKSSIILFDYHVDNLLLLEKRKSYKACGILDFQDATYGPITYDLMSLLEDARRNVEPQIIEKMKLKYLSSFPEINKEDFQVSWAIMSAQRHLRVLGTFARLNVRDNKPQYMEHIPRLWKYMDICLKHPALSELKHWINTNIEPKIRV